ncbi:CYFA0S20e02058g1_1 [Cyberlindnera fabianii]|uniref:CYFA0S20e02058g1_1 n=1 Tax=Cyberlindnera fabianii TaxID=36022 RepID=A0A061BG40_CYBFA|nr:CYFA0S20e02058g1_1 [Cyberlindnera fabianii]
MHSLSLRKVREKDRQQVSADAVARELEVVRPTTSNSTPQQADHMTRKHSLSNSFKNLFVKSPRNGPSDQNTQPNQVSPQKGNSPLGIDTSSNQPTTHDDLISPLLSPSNNTPSVVPLTYIGHSLLMKDPAQPPAHLPNHLEAVDEEAVLERPQESHASRKASTSVPISAPTSTTASISNLQIPQAYNHAATTSNMSLNKKDKDNRADVYAHKTPISFSDDGTLRIFEDGTHEHALKPIKPEKIPNQSGILSGFLRKSTRDLNGEAAFSMLPEQNRMDFQRRLSIQSRKTSDSLDDESVEDLDSDCLTDSDDDFDTEAAIGDTQLALINKLVEAIDQGEDVVTKEKDKEGAQGRNYKLTEKYGKLLGIVGKGSYGTVKVVSRVDSATKKEVYYAVKELKRKDGETTSHFSTRLTSEFVIANSLKHVNIVRTLDLMHSSAGVYSEIMEYCAAGDLYNHILKFNRDGLHSLEADCLFKQIVRGIAYCHSRGVSHCDIKPENVMLTTCGVAKLTDFGTAAVFRTAWEREVHLSSGACGSEPYVAPEEFVQKQYDPRPVDVWAAGVLFLTMVTGTYLWPVAKMEEDLYEEYLVKRPVDGKAGCFEPIESLKSGEHYKSRKAVLYGMLDPDATKRLNIHQVLKSNWVHSIKVCEAAETGS